MVIEISTQLQLVRLYVYIARLVMQVFWSFQIFLYRNEEIVEILLITGTVLFQWTSSGERIGRPGWVLYSVTVFFLLFQLAGKWITPSAPLVIFVVLQDLLLWCTDDDNLWFDVILHLLVIDIEINISSKVIFFLLQGSVSIPPSPTQCLCAK